MPVSGWKSKIKMTLGLKRFQRFSNSQGSWSYSWGATSGFTSNYRAIRDIYLYDDPDQITLFYFPRGGNPDFRKTSSGWLGTSYCSEGGLSGTSTGFSYKVSYESNYGGRQNEQTNLTIFDYRTEHDGSSYEGTGRLMPVSYGNPSNLASYTPIFKNYTQPGSTDNPVLMAEKRFLHDFRVQTFNVVTERTNILSLKSDGYHGVSVGFVIYDPARETLLKSWSELDALQSTIGSKASGSSPCYLCAIIDIDTTTKVVNDITAPSVVISTVQRLNSSGATVPDETENDPANITVTAFDDISGVNKITIDGTDYTSSLTNIPATSTTLAGKSQQVSYSGVGTKVVKATATDVDGNISTEQSYTFSIVSPAAVTCNGWDETIGVTNWPKEANTDFSTATAVAGTGSNQGWEYVVITINNGLNFQNLTLVQLGQAVRNAFHEQPTMTGYKYYSLREHWPSILNPTANLNEILMTGSDSLSYARINMKGVLDASKGGRWVSIGYCASTEILSLADFTSGPVIAAPTPTPTPPPPTTGGGSSTPTPTSSNSAGAASNYHSRLLFINI